MNLFRKRIGMGLVLLAGMLVGGIATATPVTMDFDGLTPLTSVDNYYNGGCTSGLFLGAGKKCNGTDYGVVWAGANVGMIANAPSPAGFAGFLFQDSATMNVVNGFDRGLSFYFYNVSNKVFTGSVGIYSGKNGNGTQLATAELGATRDWDFFSLAFSGIAKSVIFTGSPAYFTGFDDVTLGLDAPVHPVPEPAALGVFGLGLLLMGAFAGLRRRYN